MNKYIRYIVNKISNLKILLNCMFIVFSLLFISISADAASGNFQQYLDYAAQARNNAYNSNDIKNFDPHKSIEKFSDHPEQSKYYEGVEQTDDNGMSADAQSALTTDDAGKTVNSDFNTRPRYHVNPKSDEMLKGKFIQSDAADISLGISDKYIDCKNPGKECKTVYIDKSCNEAIGPDNAICTKNLQVKVENPSLKGCEHIVVSASKPTATIAELGPWNSAYVWLVKGPTTDGRCTVGYVYVLGQENTATGATFTVPKHFAGILYAARSDDFCYKRGYEHTVTLSTNAGQSFTSHWSGSQPLQGDVNTDRKIQLTISTHRWKYWACQLAAYGEVTVKEHPDPVITDTWVDHCGNLEQRANAGICQAVKNSCTSGKATHLIDGLEITRDCWGKTFWYNCQVAPSDNDCQYLRDQGCTQTGQSCKTSIGGICVVQNENYECPEQHCSPTNGIVCGGDFFCMNGKCSSHDPKQNEHFNQGVAGLAAVGAAAEDVKKQNINPVHIFSGTAMECSDDALGFKNCCRDSGWGKDINLAHCTSDEKKLGQARQNGLAVPAGSESDGDSNRYCHSHAPVTHTCTSHHKVYCVFPGKIARIVEWQGRWEQLKKNFGSIYGSTSNPDCNGITPDELSQIDFSKIDFKDIYDDIKNNTNFPNSDSVEQQIIQKIKNQVGTGMANSINRNNKK